MGSTFAPTILIVDDDRTNRSVLADLLKNEARLLLAKDAASGLEILARERDVSLVLLDVSMPGMNGYEMLEHMRADPALAELAVIFITALSQEADEEKGLVLGASDYVQKPIRPAIVRARVRTHLKLAMQRHALQEMVHYDGLTGIANRRFFDEIFRRSLQHAARSDSTLGLVILDVDHFKQFNDHYGHAQGDEALKKVAQVLRRYAQRPADLAARYGGEEFVLLLPGITCAAFSGHLEGLRSDVEGEGIAHASSETAAVLTVSGGALLWAPGDQKNEGGLLEQADALLYEAKRSGRNRILLRETQA